MGNYRYRTIGTRREDRRLPRRRLHRPLRDRLISDHDSARETHSVGSAQAATEGRTLTGEEKLTSDRRRLVIHATCAVHRGHAGFANVVVIKRDGTIELDPHVTGACVLTLTEGEAAALRNQLAEWLG